MSGTVTAVAGSARRECHCAIHGDRLFFQILFPGDDRWHGTCDLCKRDEELRQQARVLVNKKQIELARSAEAETREAESQIQLQADEELQEYAESLRTAFEADVRSRFYQASLAELEQEALEKILEELKKGA